MILLFNMEIRVVEAAGMFSSDRAVHLGDLEDDIGLAAHTIRRWSIFVNLGWTTVEIFLPFIKVRAGISRSGCAPGGPRFPHNGPPPLTF